MTRFHCLCLVRSALVAGGAAFAALLAGCAGPGWGPAGAPAAAAAAAAAAGGDEEARLRDLIALLGAQRERLQAEIDEMVRRFAVLRPDLPARADTITPQLIETLLGTEIRELRARATALERDLGYCRDPASLGAWLRAFG